MDDLIIISFLVNDNLILIFPISIPWQFNLFFIIFLSFFYIFIFILHNLLIFLKVFHKLL